MSRTIVDLPKYNLENLDAIAQEEGVSRAELMREAVDLLVDQRKKKKAGAIIGPDIFASVTPGDKHFWDGLDAVEWTRKIRGEWDNRDELYRDWASLTNEEWEERSRRYQNGEDI